MSFATLALICVVALIGPILAAPRGLPVLVVVGELAVGIVLGATGFGLLDPADPTFTLFADIGFALVMFVAGSNVPLSDPAVRRGFGAGALRAAIAGAIAVPLGFGLAALFGTGHGFLYAVLIASSSAAFVVPALKGGVSPKKRGNHESADSDSAEADASNANADANAGFNANTDTDVDSVAETAATSSDADSGQGRPASDRFSVTGEHADDPRLPPEPGTIGSTIAKLLPQIAIADAVCIVLIPLAIEPPKAGPVALGALLVIAAAVVVFFVLRWNEKSGARQRVKRVSEDRGLAIELRASLSILFALAALATWSEVSIMLAGFSFGLAVAAVGTPRRLTKQLFALTEGFFAPIFYVWLGASLGLRALFDHPSAILLGLGLGAAAVIAHFGGVLVKQSPSAAILTSAQLGVPIAAATTGLTLGVLAPGEDAAMLLSALVTIVVCTFAARRLLRRTSDTTSA